MRLDKYLAQAGVASRRSSKEIIAAGKITINGEIVSEPGYYVKENDLVAYQGMKIEKEHLVYYLLNKPRGVISSVADEKGRKTVLDFLLEADKQKRIFPVGRLDYDTAGAILLTNDGQLTYLLTRPEYEVPKTYLARVEGLISRQAIKTLKQGVEIENYQSRSTLVRVKEHNVQQKSSLVEIVLIEGKNQQVKKMFEAVGYPVKSLTRIGFDFLTLKGIKRGSYRELKIHEVKKLYANKKK
jgi:23S rRNA pseudouridine2605 synthase